ncbi:condensation domain-containing protein [Streptomyces sp. NPDC127079]|uniref:condensation domain-containing protein n=1 Tax=Streptomyces sp. NPDC127079 TaxID=3347132 RepID=UPI00365C29B1
MRPRTRRATPLGRRPVIREGKTIVERYTAGFAASSRAPQPLTWGQKWIWRPLSHQAPRYQHLNVERVIDAPLGCELDDVVGSVGQLLERHEALRTRFWLDAGNTPRQAVAADGEIPVEVYDTSPSDLDETVGEVVEHLLAMPFTIPELPVRAAVVTCGGTPRRIVLSKLHLAADSRSSKIVAGDLVRYIRARSHLESTGPSYRLVHPIDRVAYERSPAGVLVSEKSLRRWRQQLARFPKQALPTGSSVGRPAVCEEMAMESRALHSATRVLAARHGVTPWAVVLGLTAMLLSRLTGNSSCGLLLFCHNRIDDDSNRVSGTMVQQAPITVPTAGRDLGAVLRAAWQSAVFATRTGQYDPDRLPDLIRTVSEDIGAAPDLSCSVNLNFPPADQQALLTNGSPAGKDTSELLRLTGETRIFSCGRFPGEEMRFFLSAFEKHSAGTVVHLRADSSILPKKHIEAFLRDLEWLAVEAVRDDSLARMPSRFRDS